MKEFRKKEEHFVCEECNLIFNKKHGLSTHLRIHNGIKAYYDKWIKDDDDNKCKICGTETKFVSLISGYKRSCCRKHEMKINYGVENQYQRESVKEKCKQTMLKNHGVEHALQSDKIKNNMKTNLLENYGVNHNLKIDFVIINKKQTWMENLGVDNPSKSSKIKKQKEETCFKHFGVKAGFADDNKRKQTWIKNYGVEYPSQNKEVFERQQKSGFKLKQFKNTNIYYRGLYEFDFLEKYFHKYADIINAPSIKYKLQRKEKVYFPDFYIPSLNLIIEIKNSYLAEKDKERIKAKKQGTIIKGYKYIMIINKNYNKFDKLINEKDGA